MNELYMIPIILIGTIWGATGVVLQAFNIIIDRRDKILKFKFKGQNGVNTNSTPNNDKNLTVEQQYFYTLFPISFGIVLFLAIISGCLIILPFMLENINNQGEIVKIPYIKFSPHYS